MKLKKSHDNFFTLTSAIKYDQIEFLQKAKPDALVIKDGDGNELFGIGVSSQRGGMTSSQVVFNDKNAEGYARVTIMVVAPTDEQKKVLTERVVTISDYLAQLEASVPAAYAAAKEKYDGVLSSITDED